MSLIVTRGFGNDELLVTRGFGVSAGVIVYRETLALTCPIWNVGLTGAADQISLVCKLGTQIGLICKLGTVVNLTCKIDLEET